MTDQCGRCTLKGNLKECLNGDCGKHHDWITQELLKEIKAYKQALTRAVALPKGQLPDGQNYYTTMLCGNVIVMRKDFKTNAFNKPLQPTSGGVGKNEGKVKQ